MPPRRDPDDEIRTGLNRLQHLDTSSLAAARDLGKEASNAAEIFSFPFCCVREGLREYAAFEEALDKGRAQLARVEAVASFSR